VKHQASRDLGIDPDRPELETDCEALILEHIHAFSLPGVIVPIRITEHKVNIHVTNHSQK
jgi:hypothetical protein